MDIKERQIFWETLTSLTGENIAEDNKKLDAVIKYPKYIYRYRPINVKTIDALRNNKLYFSNSGYYDDPFDTYLRVNYKQIYEEIKASKLPEDDIIEKASFLFSQLNMSKEQIQLKLQQLESVTCEQKLEAIINLLSNFIQPSIRNKSMSVCFSEQGLNETMWLKYADQYKGFCLMYDCFDESKNLCGKTEQCKNCVMGNVKTPLYPINYSNEKYDATRYAYCLSLEFIFRQLHPDWSDQEIISKLPQCPWEREKVSLLKSEYHDRDFEWRMLYPYSSDKPIYQKWIPSAIILGLKMPDDDKPIVIDAAKAAGIPDIFTSVINLNGDLDIVQWKN